MAVDLSTLPLKRMSPQPLSFGGPQVSALGGSTTFVDRLGDRWSFACETPLMPLEPDGRQFAALLTRARREGALLPIAQPGLAIGAPGNPVTASAVASGRYVPLSGLANGYQLRAGQWLSFVVAGQRYADQVATPVTGTGGIVTVTLQNLIRVPLPQGASVEVAAPKVEGSLVDPVEWPVDDDEVTMFSFSLREDA